MPVNRNFAACQGEPFPIHLPAEKIFGVTLPGGMDLLRLRENHLPGRIPKAPFVDISDLPSSSFTPMPLNKP
jgi:hypothetical protein